MTPPFHYQDPFPVGKDQTDYYLLTKEHVSVAQFEGKDVLKVAPEGLTLLANTAFRDVAFMLRPAHQKQVAAILDDPEASENDKYVALTMLRNAEISAKGVLPFCQDTGTATVFAKKGNQVWTDGTDEEALSLGVYRTYTEENLRYSQTLPLDMYTEKNSGTNLQLKSISWPDMVLSTIFYLLPRGVAHKTKRTCFRKRKRC
jgi:fumarate hydratase, class I